MKMIKDFDKFINENFGMDVPGETNHMTEADSDANMALGQLRRTKDFAEMLIPMIEGMGDMEPWVQSKITKAEDYLNAVLNYYKGQEGVTESLDEDEAPMKFKRGDKIEYKQLFGMGSKQDWTTLKGVVMKVKNKKKSPFGRPFPHQELTLQSGAVVSPFGHKDIILAESINEAKFDKKKLLKAIKNHDDATILANGREYIIYNPDSNNQDNADMWHDDVIFALDPDGEEHEIRYKDIERFNEAKFTEYDNNELAAYVKNNPKDKEAAKELHKRSQKLKGLTRTDESNLSEAKVTKKSVGKASDDLAKIIIQLKDNLGKLQSAKSDKERAKYIEIAKDLTQQRKDASATLDLAIAKLDKNAELTATD